MGVRGGWTVSGHWEASPGTGWNVSGLRARAAPKAGRAFVRLKIAARDKSLYAKQRTLQQKGRRDAGLRLLNPECK